MPVKKMTFQKKGRN